MADDPTTEMDLLVRLDALLGQMLGGMGNVITGEGGASDRINGWLPQPSGSFDEQQLVWAFAGVPWARLICDKPARWLAQAGLRIEAAEGLPAGPDGPRGTDDVADIDEDLGLTSALGVAYKWARLFGGGGVLIDVEGDTDWSRPWVPVEGQTLRLHAYDGIALRPVIASGGDIREPGLPAIWRPFLRYDRPRLYRLQATAYTAGTSRDIHWTRVLPLYGVELPPGGAYWASNGYRSWPALSVIEHCWTQIRAFGGVDAGLERIMSILAMWVMTLPNLPALASGSAAGGQGTDSAGRSGADAMLAAISNRLRTAGVFFGPPGWDVKTASLPLTGVADVDARTRSSLAAAAECPQFVIFGEDAGGLSDGSGSNQPSWLRAWTTTLRGWWDDQWAWNVRRVLTGASVCAWGQAPTKLRVTVGPFVPTTEREEAELRKVGAEELAELVDAGILAPTEARRRYLGGYTVDFTVEDEAPPVAPPAPEPPATPPTDRADAAPQRESTLIALAQDPLPALLAEVRAIVPDLEAEDWPHVTLLYLGDVPVRDMAAIMRAVVEHAEDWPEALTPDYVGPLGDEGAVVLHLRVAGLIGPQNRLLRALTPQVRAQQFPRFRPHITLGHTRTTLTDEQIEALAALTVPDSLETGPLVLRRADEDKLRLDAEPSYVPPKGAQEAATRALAVREEKPPSERGMTAVGLARARDLANGRALSAETVRRMKAYFDRHQGDKDGATWDEQGKGWQAWMGWGGDVGWRWATRIVARLDRDA